MKKITGLAFTLCLLINAVSFYRSASAATHNVVAGSNGANCSDGGYFTPSAITIAAGETITFSVPANDPYAAGLEIHNFPGGNFTILPGGSHTTPALVISVPNYYATWPSQSGCQKGTGSVTIEQSASPPPPAPAPTPPPPPAPNKPPDALKLDKLSMEGEKIDKEKPISIDKSRPLTLSGYTVANGVVNLTVHSITRNEIARADSSGHWDFTIENLEPGNHTVEATVTDPVTKQTSAVATLLKFTVTGEPSTEATLFKSATNSQNFKQSETSSMNIKALIGVVAVLLMAGAGVLFWLKGKTKIPTEQKAPSMPPTEIKPSL